MHMTLLDERAGEAGDQRHGGKLARVAQRGKMPIPTLTAPSAASATGPLWRGAGRGATAAIPSGGGGGARPPGGCRSLTASAAPGPAPPPACSAPHRG